MTCCVWGLPINILLSSTIGRNKNLIPGEVISTIINGTEEVLEMLRKYGLNIHTARVVKQLMWAIWCERLLSTAP
jgi:hypothetical protein